MQQQQNHQQNGTIPNNNARNSASTMNGGPTTNGIVRFSEPRVPVIFVLGGKLIREYKGSSSVLVSNN